MARKKRKAAPGDVATNRQAGFRFKLLEKVEAGIVLQGSEVKSMRQGGVQMKDAYAEVRDGEVWLRNMHIAPYKPARENHDPDRPRKLLLHRREIERLTGKTAEKGLTLVPTRVYFNGSRAKVELALAQGKDLYDKRRALKERDTKREIERALSERYSSTAARRQRYSPSAALRRPAGELVAGSRAGACGAPTTRAPRPSSGRCRAAARSPCTCSRARCAGAPRARAG